MTEGSHAAFNAAYERYVVAAHKIQTAIAWALGHGSNAGTPKHLRVGLDLRASDQKALVELLIAKGIITGDEYVEAIADAAENEAEAQEEELRRTGLLPDNTSLG